MALPGTPGQRISDLCNGNHISQKQLAEKIDVSASQLSRIISGETKTVSSDILIGVAKEFKVSTDYILGLSTLSVRKSYDISELGLSEEPVKRLITGRIDINILNCLLEHEHFPRLCIMIRNFFDGTIIEGVMARNQVVDFAVDQLTDLMNAEPAKRKEIIKDKLFLNWQKLGANEADIEKIKNQFVSILRDIKSSMQNKELTSTVATAEAIKTIRDALSDKPASDITSDDVANAVAFYMGQTTDLNDKGLTMVQELAKYIFDNSVPEERSDDHW